MRWRKERVTDSCPRCNYRNEDDTHVLGYKAVSAVIDWDESTVRMKEWLDSHNSYPELCKVVLTTMDSWKINCPSNIIWNIPLKVLPE